MADEGLTPENIASFFEDKPPPSWGSPEWKWGYADGAAHDVAARVREELAMKHRRSALLSYADMGAVDFFLGRQGRCCHRVPRFRRAGRHLLTHRLVLRAVIGRYSRNRERPLPS